MADVLEKENAELLWSHANERYSPYSRVTLWTRVCSFYSWANGSKPNPYLEFRIKNARLFKNTYQPKIPEITFEEAVKKINQISNEDDRQFARRLLGSGERICESIQPTNRPTGKGNKSRLVFRPESTDKAYVRSISSFRRSLRSVGLTPHSLRKLLASRLVELGMKEADLLKVMGWSSMATAKCYLQPKSDKELSEIFKSRIHSELNKC